MENLKEEVVNLFCEYRAFECGSDMQLENKAQELTDKLIAIFDREKTRYAFNKCREILSNVEKYIGNTFSIFELSELVPKDLLIPSELQPGDENEK